MKPKFISVESGELLAYFNERNESCFGYARAFKALPHSKEGTVRELLSDMTIRGLLMRLKDGLFTLFLTSRMPNRSSRIGT